MSTQVGEIHFDLDLDHRKFSQGVNAVDGDTKTLHKGFSLAKAGAAALAVGIAAAATGIVAFGVSSVKAYNESLEAQTKLSTNLLNVKGNTDANVKSIQNLASAMQKKGVIDDDTIVAGAAQLATFNLQGKTIETLTPKIGDMIAQLKGSNATAEDAVGINNLIGKVMTGNVGALGRYGVTLDENQKKQLKNGNEAERAALLVEVLGQNYGNVNEALSKTPQGQLTMLKNRFGELQESVGNVLVKALVPVMGFVLDKVIPVFESLWNTIVMLVSGDFVGGIFGLQEDAPFISAMFTLRETLMDVWDWISNKLWPAFLRLLPTLLAIAKVIGTTLVKAFKGIIDIFGWMQEHLDIVIPILIGLGVALVAVLIPAMIAWTVSTLSAAVAQALLYAPIIAIGLAIAAVVAALIYAYTHWEGFRNVVDTTIKAVTEVIKWAWENVIKPVWSAIVWYITNILIPGIKLYGKIIKVVWDAIVAVIRWAWNTVIKPVWDVIVWYISNILVPYWTKIWDIVSWVWDKVSAYIRFVWDTVLKPVWDAIVWYITNVLIPYWQKIWDIVQPVWQKIWEVIQLAWNNIKATWESLKKYWEETLQPLWDKIKSTIINAWNSVVGPVRSAISAIKDTIQEVIDKIQELIDKIKSISKAVKDAPGKVVDKVSDFFRADGGPVSGGRPYIVGEEGPELFVPNGSGSIIDAGKTKAMGANGGGSGGSSVSLTINVEGVLADSPAAKRKFGADLVEVLNQQLIGLGHKDALIGNGLIRGNP